MNLSFQMSARISLKQATADITIFHDPYVIIFKSNSTLYNLSVIKYLTIQASSCGIV
jgi:hypothetical protein